MADTNQPTRGQSTNAWIWVVVVLIIIAIIWWWAASSKRQATENGLGQNEVVANAGSTSRDVPVAAIVDDPNNYIGQEVHGRATIAEVESPYLFQIEQNGRTLYAFWKNAPIRGDFPAAGEVIDLTGTVRDPQDYQKYVEDTFVDTNMTSRLKNTNAFIVVTNADQDRRAADNTGAAGPDTGAGQNSTTPATPAPATTGSAATGP